MFSVYCDTSILICSRHYSLKKGRNQKEKLIPSWLIATNEVYSGVHGDKRGAVITEKKKIGYLCNFKLTPLFCS